jgi:hypothetical protein
MRRDSAEKISGEPVEEKILAMRHLMRSFALAGGSTTLSATGAYGRARAGDAKTMRPSERTHNSCSFNCSVAVSEPFKGTVGPECFAMSGSMISSKRTEQRRRIRLAGADKPE